MTLRNKKELQSNRDHRTHEQRIKDLNDAFNSLMSEAIASGLKTKASAEAVLKKAKVNRTYFYKTGKLKNKDILQKYHTVRDKIKEFQSYFDSYCENTVENSLTRKLSLCETRERNLKESLISQQEQIAGLQAEIAALKNKAKLQTDNIFSVLHSHHNPLKNQLFSDAHIISLENYLWKNGQYMIDDENYNNQAFLNAIEHLKAVLSKPLPSRVYILIGAPCSGKSTWAKQNKNYFTDRHSIVIDAQNSTAVERMKWLNQIYKYQKTTDIKICAVLFLVSEHELVRRNMSLSHTKRLQESSLLKKAASLELPDINHEDFDELIILRG
ncbi:hypothetical protein [Pseudoalteromonas spongiae]|uniref:hypothetical protein n=1 Tax=Pseudoalteromonas spongiae TaxID=298657 RepID=UPI00110AF412|nr:hypothetical protein [Pseudoalteromonas spongiae]TMO83074.1 hypothetical protein CWC15_16575 [Pseudoalteromonas spongiae]